MSSGSVDLGQDFGSGGGGGGVTSLNSMTGAITLVPGTGISITPGSGTLTISSTVASLIFADSLVNNFGTVTLVNDTPTPGNTQYYGTNGSGTLGYYTLPTPGTGTVTSVSGVNTNGLSFSIANPTTTPAITLSTSFTGIAYSTGTALQTAVAGNFPTLNQNTTGTAANITATSNSTLTSLPSLILPGSQVSGNISGNAANITATSNSTLTSLPSLVLPTTQLSGDISLTTQVSGVLPFGNGGTNSTTASAAFIALSPLTTAGDIIYENSTPAPARLPIGTSGQVLTVSGGLPSWQTVTGTGTVTSVSVVSANGLAGSVANPTTTPALTLSTTVTGILQGNGTAISAASTTGTGNVVLSTSPTLVTPNLGTPSALVLTNATGLPFAQVTGFTSGSIIFAGPTGALDQDNSNFYWNDTTFNLGLGLIPATNVALDILNTSGSSKAVQETGYGTGSTPVFRGRFARGTLGTPAAAQSGDNLSVFAGRGYGTSQFATASTGIINVVAGETFTNISNATYLQFQVTPTGSVTAAEAMRINSTGDVLIGTTTDSGTQKLQVNGNSNVGTVTAGVWNGTVTKGFSFLTTGTSYTTPAGITTATLFTFVLIGGGGGGASTNSIAGGGAGGGGGGALTLYITGLAPSTAYTITIGAGGTGTTGAGNSGGSTTLVIGATTYTASGGTGAAALTTSEGGAGGTGTNGTINITGSNGDAASGVATSQSGGGGTPGFGYGLGGSGVIGSSNGNSGTGYGGGGGGAKGNGAPTAGSGSQGMILVMWDN